MEVEQMTACLLAEIRTSRVKMNANQAKADTNLREMRAGQEVVKQEMLAKLDAHHERMMVRMDSWLKKMEACLGKTEAMDLEALRVNLALSVLRFLDVTSKFHTLPLFVIVD
jgi:hypothetical protein